MSARDFTVERPDGPQRTQDEETVLVTFGSSSEPEEIRIHDYDRMYSTPGLYEAVVYEMLECQSPGIVTKMMVDEWQRLGRDPAEQRIFDIGAGNGVMGKLLKDAGAGRLVGLDNIPEAEDAAERDFPGLYADYLTADLLNLSREEEQRIRDHDLNGLACVGALGFGDIPPDAFANALDLIAGESVIGFTVNVAFLDEDNPGSFAGLIKDLSDQGVLDIARTERFRHRYAVTGEPLEYAAVVGRKLTSV